jgi:hypothetical protein
MEAVIHRLIARAWRRHSRFIDSTAENLADEFKVSPDSVRLAVRVLRKNGCDIETTRQGIKGGLPAGWCPERQRDYYTQEIPLTVENTPAAGEQMVYHNLGSRDTIARTQDLQPLEPRDKRRINGVSPGFEALQPRDKYAAELGTAKSWAASDSFQSLAVRKNNPGPGLEQVPPSNSNRILAGSAHSHAAHARSFDDSPYVEKSPAQVEATRIAGIHTLKPDQRTDADQLATALHSYMDEFGDSHRDEWRSLEAFRHDEEILARCLAVAPLGSLLQHLRVMRNSDLRGCTNYGWFLTLFGEQFAEVPRKIMRAALSQEKRSHRQTPKPKPSYETGEAPETQNPEFGANLIHQVSSVAAGRKLR